MFLVVGSFCWVSEVKGVGEVFYIPLEDLTFQMCPDEIGSVTISPEVSEVRTGSAVTIKADIYTRRGVVLTDEVIQYLNRGSITWQWNASEGDIVPIGKGTYSVYTAPDTPGTYTITVKIEEPPLQFQDTRYEDLVHEVSTQTIIVSASATIRVVAPEPTTVVITPSSVMMPVAGTQTFYLIVRDQWEGEMVGINGIFSTNIGTLSTTIGTFTIFNAQTKTGTGWFRVEVENLIATSTINLVPGPLYSIEITPSVATLTLNGTQTFLAQGYDVYGNQIATNFQWKVGDTSLGTLTVFLGTKTVFVATHTGAGGTTTLTAEKDGVVGTTVIKIIGSFVKEIQPQKAGVPFLVEVNIVDFEGEGTLMSNLEGVVGTVSVEEGKGKGTITLYKASPQQQISCYNGFGTITSNFFILSPGPVSTFTVKGIPARLVLGKPPENMKVVVEVWDQWGNKTPAPYRTLIYFTGSLTRDGGNTWDNDAVNVISSILRYNRTNKANITGDHTVELPSEDGEYRSFFTPSQYWSPEASTLICPNPETYIRLIMTGLIQ